MTRADELVHLGCLQTTLLARGLTRRQSLVGICSLKSRPNCSRRGDRRCGRRRASVFRLAPEFRRLRGDDSLLCFLPAGAGRRGTKLLLACSPSADGAARSIPTVEQRGSSVRYLGLREGCACRGPHRLQATVNPSKPPTNSRGSSCEEPQRVGLAHFPDQLAYLALC
jgi:hypothetical protein